MQQKTPDPFDSTDPLVLHILTKNDAEADTISAVENYVIDPALQRRLTIIWEKYVHPE